jgi:hypothetical protein
VGGAFEGDRERHHAVLDDVIVGGGNRASASSRGQAGASHLITQLWTAIVNCSMIRAFEAALVVKASIW